MSISLAPDPIDAAADHDDDLLHSVCESCLRILCDGDEVGELIFGVPEGEVCCAVCDDLEGALAVCPHCGSP